MLKKTILAIAIAAAAAASFFTASDFLRADGSPGIALTGQVSSEKEGPMEGVVVGAKREGSTITINVFSDEQGRYNFPASKLGPGRYSLRIRAAGYDLDGPKAVDVASGKVTTGDIKLRPTKNLAGQLSDAE